MIVYLATGEHLAYQTGILGCSTSAATAWGENHVKKLQIARIQLHDSQGLLAKLPLKTKASAFCGAPTAMTPAAAATAPVSMARARLSGAGTKAMLFRRQATAAKTHTAARRAMVRTGKGRGKARVARSFQKQLQKAKKICQFHGN